MKSVKLQIVEAWRVRMAALNNVITLVVPGQERASVPATVAAGKYAVQYLLGEDTPMAPMPSIELFTFDVFLAVHGPAEGDDYDAAINGVDDVLKLIYGTYGTLDTEDFGGLARSARCLMFMDGPYQGTFGGLVSCHAFQIAYGFRRGDPTTAA